MGAGSGRIVVIYRIGCKQCRADNPYTFTSKDFPTPEKRGAWARAHRGETGHSRWLVDDIKEVVR